MAQSTPPVKVRQAEDFTGKSQEEISALAETGSFVPGDTYNEYVFNGTQWAKKNQQASPMMPAGAQAAANAMGTAMNSYLRQAHGEDDKAQIQRQAAENTRNSVGVLQEAANRNRQIANRNERVEASKDAAASAAAQFNQRMAQQKASSGGGAAVLASLNTVDPTANLDALRNRADTAHDKYTAGAKEVEAAKQTALAQQADADNFRQDYLNDMEANERNKMLSMGYTGEPDEAYADENTAKNLGITAATMVGAVPGLLAAGGKALGDVIQKNNENQAAKRAESAKQAEEKAKESGTEIAYGVTYFDSNGNQRYESFNNNEEARRFMKRNKNNNDVQNASLVTRNIGSDENIKDVAKSEDKKDEPADKKDEDKENMKKRFIKVLSPQLEHRNNSKQTYSSPQVERRSKSTFSVEE